MPKIKNKQKKSYFSQRPLTGTKNGEDLSEGDIVWFQVIFTQVSVQL